MVNGPEIYFLIAGTVLLLMAVLTSTLARLPLTTGLVYMAIGVALGPQAANILRVDLLQQSRLVEHLTEVAILISLFTTGLKLRLPLRHPRWRLPVRLAGIGMVLTAAGVTLLAALLLRMPWALAVMLGGILAPTDPVLASDVQVDEPGDRDAVRFALTGEAGLNDGTAFPVLMLGLGLAGIHELGAFGWRWVGVDVLWASAAGLGIGGALGHGVARFVLYLRREHKEALGLDDFLALGLIGSSYGLALVCHAYGFLAVFAAGLALRQIEAAAAGGSGQTQAGDSAAIDSSPSAASQEMTHQVLAFNEQIERIGEVAVVVLLGTLLRTAMFSVRTMLFGLCVFVVIRPAAVYAAMWRTHLTGLQRRLIAWFGVRGAGSLFYLAYAATHGVAATEVRALLDAVLPVVALSIVIHGISVTPLMNLYRRRMHGRLGRQAIG